MSYKLFETNGIDITALDGAAFNNFLSGGEDSIVAGVYDECNVTSSASNSITLSRGLMNVHGFRVKVTEAQDFTFSSTPAQAIDYQLFVRITANSGANPVALIAVRSVSNLSNDEIFDVDSGIYEAEIARFTNSPNGITNIQKTLPVKRMRKTIDIVQSLGQSTTAVMSQKAVTDIISTTKDAIKELYNGEELPYEELSVGLIPRYNESKHYYELSTNNDYVTFKITPNVGEQYCYLDTLNLGENISDYVFFSANDTTEGSRCNTETVGFYSSYMYGLKPYDDIYIFVSIPKSSEFIPSDLSIFPESMIAEIYALLYWIFEWTIENFENVSKTLDKTNERVVQLEAEIEDHEQRIDFVENLLSSEMPTKQVVVEDTYETRITADGLPVINEQMTEVSTIKGSTVVHTEIGGGGSASVNLLTLPYQGDKGSVNVGQSVTENGVTFTVQDDGSIKAQGTVEGIAPTFNIAVSQILLKKNTTYTIGLVGYNNVTTSLYYIACPDGLMIDNNATRTSNTFTTTDTEFDVYIEAIYLWLSNASAGDVIDETYYPMLVEGDTLPSEFSIAVPQVTNSLKHAKISGIESKSGNLLPYPYYSTTKTMNGLTFTDLGDGGVRIDGTSTANTGFEFTGYRGFSLPAGSYNFTSTIGVSGAYCVASLYKDANYVKRLSDATYGNFKITEAESDEEYSVVCQVYINSGYTFDSVVVYPMLNKGSQAIAWQPPNATDTLNLSDTYELGEWDSITFEQDDIENFANIKRATKILELNGTENWTYYEKGKVFYTRISRDTSLYAETRDVVSTDASFVWSTTGLTDYGYQSIQVANTGMTTVEELKAWLAENPVTVAYELANPTTEKVWVYTPNSVVGYKAWNRGTETILGNENAQYGANVTVEQSYLVKVGG